MDNTEALSGLRVLEYGNMVSGPFCARLLADSGADCVKVEPPGGDESRGRGPFHDDAPDPDFGGLYLYLNANKRGVTLDLETSSGRASFGELASRADVVVVNGLTRDLERLGLLHRDFVEVNPGLIVTAITPFGLTGPRRYWAGDDLVAVASGGLMYATPGLPDMVHEPELEPPLRANAHVGEMVAGIHAAAATVAAVLQAELTGEGCQVDVSQQEAVAMVLSWEIAHASYLAPKAREPFVFATMPNSYLPCKDGHVVVVGYMDRHFKGLAELMGMPELADMEVFADTYERSRNWDALEPLVLEWTMAHTGEEIARMAQERGVPCFPASSVGQMVESEHVLAREYLWTHELPGGGSVKVPGNPMRMAKTPPALRRRAPALGEHTLEVMKEWLGQPPQSGTDQPRGKAPGSAS